MKNENQQGNNHASPFDHLNLDEFIHRTTSGIPFFNCTDLTIKAVCQVGTETKILDASIFKHELRFRDFEITVSEFLDRINSKESSDPEGPSDSEKKFKIWRNLDLWGD